MRPDWSRSARERPGTGGSIRRSRSTRTPSPQSAYAADTRAVVAVDWSRHQLHATTDGQTVYVFPSYNELLTRIDRPAKIVCESTLESWDAEQRVAFLQTVRAAGHQVYVFRPKNTGWLRKRLGIEKSDINDTKLIHQIATEGKLHLYPAPDLDPAWSERRDELAADYVQIRLTERKPELIAAVEDIIGNYADLPVAHRRVLGNGRHYSASLTAAVAFAAAHMTSRASFERLLGLHGSGYPSILRSEVIHHAYRHACRRGVSWRDFRRSLRWTFAQLKPAREQLLAVIKG